MLVFDLVTPVDQEGYIRELFKIKCYRMNYALSKTDRAIFFKVLKE